MKKNPLMLFLHLAICTTPVFASPEIEAFKQSWVAKTLQRQREIDINTPFKEANFIGTHNSFNSKAYQIPLVRYMDPNQTLSIYDQLELGVRSVELDVHWTLTKSASKDILLCHGRPTHIGCDLEDRPIGEGLKEIRDWLLANPNEVVLLYIERHLDGHEPRLANEINNYIGEFIFKPTTQKSNQCESLPGTLTKAEILKAGKQLVIITKNCDGGTEENNKFTLKWNDVAFAGMGPLPLAPFTFLDPNISDFKTADCGKSTFNRDPDHLSMWRIMEDRTTIGKILNPTHKYLEVNDMSQLTHCGINWPTMDMLAINDARLMSAIWSWLPTYPKENQGECAVLDVQQKGIKNIACTQSVPAYTCQEKNTHAFKVISLLGMWSNGESVCQTLAGKNWHFATPINGGQMTELQIAAKNALTTEVWLNYKTNGKGKWIVNTRS